MITWVYSLVMSVVLCYCIFIRLEKMYFSVDGSIERDNEKEKKQLSNKRCNAMIIRDNELEAYFLFYKFSTNLLQLK